MLLIFVLSGCATKVVSSTERSVIVNSEALNAGEAHKLADAECAKYGKFARLVIKAGYWERNYVFDCVK